MTVPGVGHVVALTYRATVDVPARFRKQAGRATALRPRTALQPRMPSALKRRLRRDCRDSRDPKLQRARHLNPLQLQRPRNLRLLRRGMMHPPASTRVSLRLPNRVAFATRSISVSSPNKLVSCVGANIPIPTTWGSRNRVRSAVRSATNSSSPCAGPIIGRFIASAMSGHGGSKLA